MKHISIAFSVILAVLTARIVVADERPEHNPEFENMNNCQRGSSYWCQNLKTARQCQTFHHCVPIWDSRKVTEDTDHVCKICKDMVQQARDQYKSDQTYEDLKYILEENCKLIQITSITKECTDVAPYFIPEFVEEPGSHLSPLVACYAARLCNNSELDKLIGEQ